MRKSLYTLNAAHGKSNSTSGNGNGYYMKLDNCPNQARKVVVMSGYRKNDTIKDYIK
jgi:hypothetical protein